MALVIYNANDFTKKLKATIQATGRLGFSDETAKTLDLSVGKFVVIARDEDTKQFYLAVCESENNNAFKIFAAGQYFYLNTTGLFKELEIDYTSRTVIYDLRRCEEFDSTLGGEAYSMTERLIPKKEGGKNM